MKTKPDLIRRTLLAAAIMGLTTVPVGAATITVSTTDDAIEDTGFC